MTKIPKSPWLRIRQIIRHEGPFSLWFGALAWLGYRRNLFLTCKLNSVERPSGSADPLDIELMTEGEVDEYIAFRRGARKTDIHSRFRLGFKCYAARYQDTMVSTTWVARGWAILWTFNARFALEEDQLYVFDSYTTPDFRGKRIQQQVFRRLAEDAIGVGCTDAVLFVDPQNRPNLKSRKRSGFVPKGSVTWIGIGTWNRYSSTEAAPILQKYEQ